MGKKLMFGKWHKRVVWYEVLVLSFWTNLPRWDFSMGMLGGARWHSQISDSGFFL